MNTKTAMRYHYTAIKMAKSKKTDLIQCKATGAVIACRWNAKWQNLFRKQLQFSSVQSLSSVRLFATPWTAACQASLSITNSWSPSKPMSIESVTPSNHFILCLPLLLLPSIFPSIRVFSNESVLCIRWPNIGVSASTSVLPMNTQDRSPLGGGVMIPSHFMTLK